MLWFGMGDSYINNNCREDVFLKDSITSSSYIFLISFKVQTKVLIIRQYLKAWFYQILNKECTDHMGGWQDSKLNFDFQLSWGHLPAFSVYFLLLISTPPVPWLLSSFNWSLFKAYSILFYSKNYNYRKLVAKM